MTSPIPSPARTISRYHHHNSRRRCHIVQIFASISLFMIFCLMRPSNAAEDKVQEVQVLPDEEDIKNILSNNNMITNTNMNTDASSPGTETTNSKENADADTDEDSSLKDEADDGFFYPLHSDPSCVVDDGTNEDECWNPPETTVEMEDVMMDASAIYGGNDPSETNDDEKDDEDDDEDDDEQEASGDEANGEKKTKRRYDKHWGRDEKILKMRDKLRNMGRGTAGSSNDPHENKRPPIFLLPGLASTRLVAWKHKACSNPLLSDVKVMDYVWVNVAMVFQMATLDDSCFLECMTLGLNQTDNDDYETGCKLRPEEGLDAISSIAPFSIGSNVLVGQTNTVYAWLIQWLADNLGYDVTNIIGLPYDWRLSPDVMEARDGFLTLTRKRIEAAVASSGQPGIMVAHSMGNIVFRYFLTWLKNEMHEEAYKRLVSKANRREMAGKAQAQATRESNPTSMSNNPGWVNPSVTENNKEGLAEYKVTDKVYKLANSVVNSFDEIWHSYVANEAPNSETGTGGDASEDSKKKHSQLWELAQAEGDDEYLEWINKHVWTYIGLSAPMLGAINPLRAVLSGENMGMPMTEKTARMMELSFGATHTLNPISASKGFCDNLNGTTTSKNNLACLDELIDGIEKAGGDDPWHNFPALKALLKDRVDWDSDIDPISVNLEECDDGPSDNPTCQTVNKTFTPKDVQSGEIFKAFNSIWKEENEPLKIKLEQLQKSWWQQPIQNLLNSTWDRPHIKHVILSYGTDLPTEVGYVYNKTNNANEKKDGNEYDGIPLLTAVVFEDARSRHFEEMKVTEQRTLKESVLLKKKQKRRQLHSGKKGSLHRSGDASVPYISLAWSHTWLLHATRAMRHSRFYGMKEGDRISDDNALDSIRVSYRPAGGSEWVEGMNPQVNEENRNEDEHTKDDGHPHGTKYKPEMYRYQSKGKSRTSGMEYTTAVIEAVGIEHRETTRNYDILAACFTEVLQNMHDDFGSV